VLGVNSIVSTPPVPSEANTSVPFGANTICEGLPMSSASGVPVAVSTPSVGSIYTYTSGAVPVPVSDSTSSHCPVGSTTIEVAATLDTAVLLFPRLSEPSLLMT
jgi:hypothetical protein